MLDDQIGSSDHARKKCKIIGPAHFFTLIFHLISNLAPEMWPDSLSPAQQPFLQNSIQIKKSQDGLVQWFRFLQFYVIYMVLCQIQLKLFIVTNLRPTYGPRGLCGVIRNGSPVWRLKSMNISRTKGAQQAAKGPVWMPQALDPLCLIHFWSWENFTFP